MAGIRSETERNTMKEYFAASLCRGGILGGGIVADDESITYKTGKVTVSPRFRNLQMKYADIHGFTMKRILLFPVFSISMSDGETYTFIVFGSRRFKALMNEKTIH